MRLAGPIDVPGTLQGGQAFRWRRHERAWWGAIGDVAASIEARPAGAAEARAWPRRPAAFFSHYLGLDDAARRERLSRDPVLARALAAHPGLRVLRQAPFETTIAFITSANNNVLRIESILARIAETWGALLDTPDGAPPVYGFPDVERLGRATDARLRTIGLGYRAPFVREAARMIARGDVELDALRGAAPDEARSELMRLPGVGPKVADCIALFSLDVTGAFPLDRWVLRAVSEAYFEGRPIKAADATMFARERWGDDAGLAQQLLFHAVRLRAEAPGTARLA